MDEFTEDQQELYDRPVIKIKPAFNGEWTIETFTFDGDIEGRFHAIDNNMLIIAIQRAIDSKGPEFGPEVN